MSKRLSSFFPQLRATQLFMRSDTVFYFTVKQAKQLPLDEVDFLLQAPRSRSSDNVGFQLFGQVHLRSLSLNRGCTLNVERDKIFPNVASLCAACSTHFFTKRKFNPP
jgi:hypothetical protein